MQLTRAARTALAAAVLLAPLPPARAADAPADVVLRGVDGRAVALRELPAPHLLVYFGYTGCADICPTALQDMASALRALGPLAAGVQPVMVTIDPARDTPAALAAYVAAFESPVPVLALTGSEAEIAAAARAFHVHVVRYQDPDLADYSLDHSSSLFLLDAGRRLVDDLATPELPPAELAARLRAALAGTPAVPLIPATQAPPPSPLQTGRAP